MKHKFSSMGRVAIALVLALSLSLVMAVPVSATHTSSATIAFADGASTVAGAENVVLDVTVTNDAASAGEINEVKINFTDSDFIVTGRGIDPTGWPGTGPDGGNVVTYTADSGYEIASGASVIFSPVVTNPIEAGDAIVPDVSTTDAGSKAALEAAEDTGWIGYEAVDPGVAGNAITVEYIDPFATGQPLAVSVDGKAITVNLATDDGGVLISEASAVATAINDDIGVGGAAELVDATVASGHETDVLPALVLPAFTGGTSQNADKDCPVTPAVLTVIGQKPVVSTVEPAEGNVGDTMWVEVTGEHFTGTADTNACTTDLDFGTGIIEVLSRKFIDTDEIDCQIKINATGTPTVVATTAAGASTGGPTFTAKTEGTKQVDVWEAYTPTATTFVIGTLDWKATETTIGAAITAADADDTLVAHSATYPETITIDVPGLAVESIMGAADTIIDANGLDPAGIGPNTIHIAAVMITAEGVTFGGTDKGFTVKDAGLGVETTGDPGDWFDENEDGLADVTGVYIWPNGGTNTPATTDWCRVNVIGNTIYGSQARGILADAVKFPFDDEADLDVVCVNIAENTVYDNLFEGFQGCDLGSGLLWVDSVTTPTVDADSVIENNEFKTNGPSGVDGWTDAGIEINRMDIAETCFIRGNDVHDNFHAGIYLIAEATGTVTIEQNTIHDNGSYGIYSKAPDPTKVTCQYNDIYGNTDWGIKNTVAIALVAKYNWWGHISGPSTDPDPADPAALPTAYGEGDPITTSVTFDPWLTRDQDTAVTSGIAYHGDTYPLEAGWNTLSVPLALDDGADTLSDIVALGDFIISDPTDPDRNYLGGYYYDAVNGLWVELPGAYEFAPCKAVYVKMAADASFPILYSGVFVLPSQSLVAGWNLIGSAFGIDDGYGIAAPDDPTHGQKEVDFILSSLSASCSVIVSPSMPGQEEVWATTYTAEIEGDLKMCVGQGYWVFLTAPATLAGFEVTPIYWIAE